MSGSEPENVNAAPEADYTSETEESPDPRVPEVVTKYHTAGEVVNYVLLKIIEAAVPGADVAELCDLGDKLVEEKTKNLYSKKKGEKEVRRGGAFPTCVTVNELVGHHSPLEKGVNKLNEGDVVKIDLGVHIDGYIAVGGHTIVCGAAETPVTGRKADVVRAAWTAAEAALRTVQIGKTNADVAQVINTAVQQFNCTPVQGVLSHQMKQFVIDGSKCILPKETIEEKVELCTFEPYEVYGVDIVVSSGEGKTKDSGLRTTVYKRDVEVNYTLKTTKARLFVREVNQRFPALPFSLRAFGEETATLLGVSECMRHGLLHPYPVVTEKAGAFVAQFKFTILLMPNGAKKITGLSMTQDSLIKSDFEVKDEELKQLLAKSANPKKNKKKAKSANKEGKTTAAQE